MAKFIMTLHKNKIPFSITMQELQKTFKRWLLFKNSTQIFEKFDLFLASNKDTVSYLKELEQRILYITEI